MKMILDFPAMCPIGDAKFSGDTQEKIPLRFRHSPSSVPEALDPPLLLCSTDFISLFLHRTDVTISVESFGSPPSPICKVKSINFV
ncbi:hypothetical protein HanRHA438_Chr09g0378551 [Helianthus annuus]|nr:hypothetical protein HanRHA438_Chr09g0378551 [Helianthus annuus]